MQLFIKIAMFFFMENNLNAQFQFLIKIFFISISRVLIQQTYEKGKIFLMRLFALFIFRDKIFASY